MKIKQGICGIVSVFIGCTVAAAGDMGSMFSVHNIHPVVTLQGGYASLYPNSNSRRFVGTDSDVFTYNGSSGSKNAGILGAFFGGETALPWVSHPGLFMQAGIEYNYFGNVGVSGANTVGEQSETITSYHYHYTYQAQQVLGVVKLFGTVCERIHPYAAVGLGAALNHVGQYQTKTTETGGLNITPGFNNQNSSHFSYGLGLGVDAEMNKNIRMGLGYRYSNFGSSSLGNGAVTFNQYRSSVPFSLGSSNAYAHQLFASVSFVG